MVYLNRISTRSGDDGTTGLGDGTRVPKTHPRIAAYGGVDELNSVVGLALAEGLAEPAAGWLAQVQNDLFDLGADLCRPQAGPCDGQPALRVCAAQVERLERWIDEANEGLAPLTSFVLPSGTPASARLHHARTVCRRVEIGVLHLAEFEEINQQVHVYLNRLSDLLFVLARLCNGAGANDVLWVPGQGRGDQRPSSG